MSRPPFPRITRPVAAALLAAACLAAVAPALASSTHSRGLLRQVAPPVRRAATSSVRDVAMIAPLPGPVPHTASQVATAARTCVRYATSAGWPNNGYYSGDLVTAAAICVAESAGDPKLYVCDANGVVVGHGDYVPGTPVNCPNGTTSYDRGLWQLNSAVPNAATDHCAFDPLCNADTAYLASGRGTDFSFWSSYDQDVYTPFIDPVQGVVTNLRSGTVTSALLGECLTPAKSAVNARVVIANCGIGSSLQLWSVGGGKLKSGAGCAAIGAGASPGVVLRRCARNVRQQWQPLGRDELRNRANGKCLTDPKSSLTAGTQVEVTACANAKSQTWWLP